MEILVALVSFFALFGAWMILPSSPRTFEGAKAKKLDVVARTAA